MLNDQRQARWSPAEVQILLDYEKQYKIKCQESLSQTDPSSSTLLRKRSAGYFEAVSQKVGSKTPLQCKSKLQKCERKVLKKRLRAKKECSESNLTQSSPSDDYELDIINGNSPFHMPNLFLNNSSVEEESIEKSVVKPKMEFQLISKFNSQISDNINFQNHDDLFDNLYFVPDGLLFQNIYKSQNFTVFSSLLQSPPMNSTLVDIETFIQAHSPFGISKIESRDPFYSQSQNNQSESQPGILKFNRIFDQIKDWEEFMFEDPPKIFHGEIKEFILPDNCPE